MAIRSILNRHDFWENEDVNYEAGGALWAVVPEGSSVIDQYKEPHELLWFVVGEIKRARGLTTATEVLAENLGKWHGLTKVSPDWGDYVLEPGMPINVGVQFDQGKESTICWPSGEKTTAKGLCENPYSCYKNVGDEVRAQVKENVRLVREKNMGFWKWVKKVEGGGDWDYKTHKMTSSVFPTDFTANSFPNKQRSQFFHMDGFSYKSTQPNLLRYDDVGNINYGATGSAMKRGFLDNHGYTSKSF